MKTLLEILKLSTQFLDQKGIAQPRRQAEDLICDALSMQRMQLYIEFDRPMLDNELETCRKRLQRRAQGEPVQYIHGEMEFYGCKIKVTPDVLIPRQETEILVDKIIQRLTKQDLSGKKLWDVCCGSGCIGIAIKKHLPQLEVILSDISPKVLTLAKENAAVNEVSLGFLQGNFLEPFIGMKTDFFVCNPPYISEQEYQELDAEVRNFEPKYALVAQDNGLEFYQKLSQQLKTFLLPQGMAWLEIGHSQGKAIKTLFSASSWQTSRIEQDWAGKDRFFLLENE